MSNTGVLRLIFDDTTLSLQSLPSGNRQDSTVREACLINHLDVSLRVRTCKPQAGHGIFCAIVPDNSSGETCGGHKKTQAVALKWALEGDGLKRLSHEYSFYQEHLKSLQGTLVPKCLGLFAGMSGGTPFVCMALEWCSSSTLTVGGRTERNRLKMLTMCSLHQAGIVHGQINSIWSHHFILDDTGRFRVIDFAEARIHDCQGAYPRLKVAATTGCSELCFLENELFDNTYHTALVVPAKTCVTTGILARIIRTLAYYAPTIGAIADCLQT